MQDGFEKDVQKRLQDFDIDPSPQVWNEIDAALSEKKRRRFIIWWWLLPLMLAGGSIIWFSTNYKSYVPPAATSKKEEPGENSNQIILKENKNEEKEKGKNANQDGKINSNQYGLRHSDNSGLAASAGTKNGKYENKADQTNIEAAGTEPSEVDKKIIQQNNTGISLADRKVDSSKKEATLSIHRRDPFCFQFAVKDSASEIAQKAKNEAGIRKSGKWLITIGTGITSTKEHGSSNLLDPDKSFDQSTGAVNGPGNYSSSPDSSYKIIKPDNGFHFTAGVLYQYSLSNKWMLSSGLQYRFLTNKQKTGKYIYSSAANYSPGNSGQYYQAGYKNDITNKAHWLEIPLNIAYNINPAAKTKIQLGGGASYAWMFADKWLIPDSRSNRLYYSKQLLNKNIFNWQTRAAVIFPLGWIIGLQYQQSISTVANKSVEPHLYWQSFSLHAAFPLQTKNH